MSKRQKVTIDDLNREERLVLCAVSDALRKKDKRVSLYISKKSVDVSVYPWSEERTAHWMDEDPAGYVCSACGCASASAYNYCPDCGARMEASGDG